MFQKLRNPSISELAIAAFFILLTVILWNEHDLVHTLLWNSSSAFYNAQDTVYQADELLYDSRPIVHQALIHVDQAAGETSRTMQHIAHASQDEEIQQAQLMVASNQVLDKISKLADTSNEQVGLVGEQFRFALSNLETTEKTANVVLSDLDRDINDPNITGTFSDIHGATTEFKGTMFEVHGTATDFHDYIHRLTAPVGFWKSFAKHALTFGEKVGANAITP